MVEHILHRCVTAEDYTRMFSVPCGSCMVLNPEGYGHDLWRAIKQEFNLYPSAWYHYEPHSRGVWLEEDGVPVARGMEFRNNANMDVWPFYGDVKAISFGYADLMEDMLGEGKRLISGIPTITEFEVPGIDTGIKGEGVVCPLPHCDAHRKDFSVTYDKGTKVFTFFNNKFAPKKAFMIDQTYDHNGYLRSSEVLNKKKRKGFNYAGW